MRKRGQDRWREKLKKDDLMAEEDENLEKYKESAKENDRGEEEEKEKVEEEGSYQFPLACIVAGGRDTTRR